MARQTITRLASRIEGLAERHSNREWTTVCGGSTEECQERLERGGPPVNKLDASVSSSSIAVGSRVMSPLWGTLAMIDDCRDESAGPTSAN